MGKKREKPKTYTTHEEFIERMRALGIPCEDVTPARPEDRQQDIFMLQAPKGANPDKRRSKPRPRPALHQNPL
jgi:hypothetical protein